MFHVPEQHRVLSGQMRSDSSYGCNGAFRLPPIISGRNIWCIVSDGEGWEHVSVSIRIGAHKTKTPTWDEMCYVKDMFWGDDDVVVQYHPKKSEYVNNHPNVLHLWRPCDTDLLRPPPILVGYKNATQEEVEENIRQGGSYNDIQDRMMKKYGYHLP